MDGVCTVCNSPHGGFPQGWGCRWVLKGCVAGGGVRGRLFKASSLSPGALSPACLGLSLFHKVLREGDGVMWRGRSPLNPFHHCRQGRISPPLPLLCHGWLKSTMGGCQEGVDPSVAGSKGCAAGGAARGLQRTVVSWSRALLPAWSVAPCCSLSPFMFHLLSSERPLG